MAHIFQINASDGGVPKYAVPQARVSSVGLVGDRQINTDVHGGPERALCLFSLELILALQREGHPIFPGAIGENLTLSSMDWALVVPGTVLRIAGSVCIEVTRYTTPCNTLVPYFSGGDYSRVSQKAFPGWSRVYTRVLQEGEIRVGDKVELA